jgi:hypothetical protein
LTRHRSICDRYATLARELGLLVAHLDPIGWSDTSVPEPTAARYTEALAELGAALVLWRRAEQPAPAGPGPLPQRPGTCQSVVVDATGWRAIGWSARGRAW